MIADSISAGRLSSRSEQTFLWKCSIESVQSHVRSGLIYGLRRLMGNGIRTSWSQLLRLQTILIYSFFYKNWLKERDVFEKRALWKIDRGRARSRFLFSFFFRFCTKGYVRNRKRHGGYRFCMNGHIMNFRVSPIIEFTLAGEKSDRLEWRRDPTWYEGGTENKMRDEERRDREK